jgi:hypothetical protein
MTLWQSSGHKFSEFTTENPLRLVCEVQLKCGILFSVLIAIVLRQSKWQPQTRRGREERNQDNIYELLSYKVELITISQTASFFAPLRSCD